MQEGGISANQIGPEELVLELQFHRAGRISTHFGYEEQAGCDLVINSSRLEFSLFPHDHAQRVDPPCGLFQHVLDDHGIRRLRLTHGDRVHHRIPSSTTANRADLRGRTLSRVKTARPSQTRQKPLNWALVNGSWNAYTPSRNWMVGAMYCRMPITDSGTR